MDSLKEAAPEVIRDLQKKELMAAEARGFEKGRTEEALALMNEHQMARTKIEEVHNKKMEEMKTYYEGMGGAWKAVGFDKGYGRGRREGFEEGHIAGLQKGLDKGSYLGWNQGNDRGMKEGEKLGYGKGKDRGWSMGYCQGEDDNHDLAVFDGAKAEGKRKGWEKGYSEGVEKGKGMQEVEEERLKTDAFWEGHAKGWKDYSDVLAKRMRAGRLEMVFHEKGSMIVLSGNDGEEDLMEYSTKGKQKGKKTWTVKGKGARKGRERPDQVPFGPP